MKIPNARGSRFQEGLDLKTQVMTKVDSSPSHGEGITVPSSSGLAQNPRGRTNLSRRLEKIPALFLFGSEFPSLNQCVLKDGMP